jgi:hypothetical protein
MRRTLLLAFLLLMGGTSSALAQSDSLERISRASPFDATCGGPPAGGQVFINAEVEPWVSANPRNDDNLVAVWQQDRWSNGGAQGNLTGVSFDRGRSWRLPKPPPFSRCAGGEYDRASDPWVSFGGDGSAHQIALAISADQTISAILVSSSRDGGRTWGPITTLQRDTSAALFNDKESITADPRNGRFVYAVWDRLQIENPADPRSRFSGDTLFARSTDGGRTWEPTRTILNFPDNSNTQTLGNEIVVLSDGTVVNVFDMIVQGLPLVAVQRSTDRGVTWSEPIIVDVLFSSATQGQGVVDPRDRALIRTGDLLVEAAADPRRRSDTIHIVWQDIRFTLAAPLPIFNDQIVIASSEDGGLTWSDPKRISSNKLTQAFTGSVEVNEDGDIGVTYYDFTADDPAGTPLQTDYWFTSSRDGGATFSARRRLTERSFDMRTAPFANGFFVGDYEGLTTAGERFLPVFVTANDGNLANRTDVFSTAVRASAGSKASRARAARRAGRVSSTRLARLVKSVGAIQGAVRSR